MESILKDRVSSSPTSPGIYFFKNIKDEIIYIGKAKSIRNRVRSYFSSINKKDSKTQIMVRHISDVDWMVVRSETEALLAEANLIKEHKPRYNVFLKDDKTFPYIKITKEFYPRIEIIRMKNLKKDKHIYFGPYTDIYHLREILRSIHRIFHLRTCSFDINTDTIKRKKHKVCLDYHIKRCEGPCEGLVSVKDYGKMIDRIQMFLRGKSGDLRYEVKKLMDEASDELRYEDAARFRDQLNAIDSFIKKQKKISHDFMDRDIICISAEGSLAVAILIRVRNGHIVGRSKFNINVADDKNFSANIESFIAQHYSSSMDLPLEILVEHKIDGKDALERWLTSLKGAKISILSPKIGEKRSLVEMCRKNADLQLKELRAKNVRRRETVSKVVERLQLDLGMDISPRRIEAFDNSNIQGNHPVAGMVCFIDGKPKKREYRKFNIKTVKGVDDFAMMHEVVSRRYKRVLSDGDPLPDLVLIDGGKGQLSAAKSALDNLGLGYISVVGLAKKLEEVFKPGMSDPQTISKGSPGLFLLRKIRDEVHRFAITFHRLKRSEDMTKSIFDDIKGLGKIKIQRLWSSYKNLEEIRNSSTDDISKKLKVSKEIAVKILNKSFN